jgi:hypothetical protein
LAASHQVPECGAGDLGPSLDRAASHFQDERHVSTSGASPRFWASLWKPASDALLEALPSTIPGALSPRERRTLGHGDAPASRTCLWLLRSVTVDPIVAPGNAVEACDFRRLSVEARVSLRRKKGLRRSPVESIESSARPSNLVRPRDLQRLLLLQNDTPTKEKTNTKWLLQTHLYIAPLCPSNCPPRWRTSSRTPRASSTR